ncbi:MAG TPA: efflux transporter outer membrane subunit [Acetobacteraceae bacterium]|nr:efflux transporter outer membrane subunit [Acetobacteraceae bacterium]
MRRPGLAIAMALALGGCTVGPDFTPPHWANPVSWFTGEPKAAHPEPSETVAAPVNVAWWSLFHDPRLTALERQVASNNFDVLTATARLAQSRAQLGLARAAEFPTIGANGSYTRERASGHGIFSNLSPNAQGAGTPPGQSANGAFGNSAGGPQSPTTEAPFDIYQYGFDAAWELDLWGQVRRSVESATASVNASADARRAALISALAEVARDYIELRGVQEQLRIARENVNTARQGLKLTQERAAAGVTTDLDVANAAAQLRTTAAQIPALQQQEHQFINALSFLLAKPPNALTRELAVPRPVPPVPPRVPVGFPSELARRRPDIREAEAQLHAATANIGVAVAAYYPQVTLNGSFGFQALDFGNLWTGAARQYALGPSISIPIFQGGQIRQTVVLRKAQQQEAAIGYQRTVLAAWHDVDNALDAYRREQQRRDQLIQAVADNRRALALAQSRYQQGVANFLDVLTAETNLLSTEQQLASSTTAVSANLVALYKALGGGWENTYPDTGPPHPPAVLGMR